MGSPRASAKTKLSVGIIEAPIALYKTKGDRKRQTFVEAGPNGKPLETQEVPVEGGEPDLTDPLGTHAQEAEHEAEKAAEPEADDRPEKVHIPEEVAPVTKTVLVEQGTGEFVDKDNMRRGLRDDDGNFIDLTEDLKKIDDDTALERMEITSFIRTESVPRERVEAAYHIAYDGPGARKLIDILWTSLRNTGRVGVVKWTKRSRQALGVLVPRRGALMVLELTWSAEFRREVPAKSKVSGDLASSQEVAAFEALIEAMASGPEALDEFDDDSIVLYEDLAEKAMEGTVFKMPERVKAAEAQDDLVALAEAHTATVAA